jgi:hypothetical protein
VHAALYVRDMATVAEVLSRFGVEATEDDLAAAVEQVIVESLTPPRRRPR